MQNEDCVTSGFVSQSWSLWLGLWPRSFFIGIAGLGNLYLAAEAPVIGVTDQHSEMRRLSLGEVQYIIRVRVSRKPVAPVNLLPVSFKDGKPLVTFGHAFTRHFDDLQVSLIYPDAALEKTLADLLWQNLRADLKDISVQLIKTFFSSVLEVVLLDLRRLERKRLDAAQVVKVLLSEPQFG